MIVLSEPDPSDMVQAVKKAIAIVPKIDPQTMHLRVSYLFKMSGGLILNYFHCFSFLFCFCLLYELCQMKKLYSWHDVARRTEIVYEHALRCSNQNLLERLSRYGIKT